MLKNKKVILFCTALLVLYGLSLNSGICVEDIAQYMPDAQPSELHSTIFKFLKVMGGVAVSSVIIFSGLWIYNKLFVRNSVTENIEEQNSLCTPRSVDSAIAFFIKRNKL